MKLIRIEISTFHFDFYAYGKTKKEAQEVMKKVWQAHIKEYGQATLTIKQLLEDANYVTVEAGAGFRDYTRLV